MPLLTLCLGVYFIYYRSILCELFQMISTQTILYFGTGMIIVGIVGIALLIMNLYSIFYVWIILVLLLSILLIVQIYKSL